MGTSHILRRVVVAGGLAFAAMTVGALAALSGPEASSTATGQGQCLAWFGSRGDGQCIGYSNGSPTYIGTPQGGLTGSGTGTTGPLLPGQSFNQSLSP